MCNIYSCIFCTAHADIFLHHCVRRARLPLCKNISAFSARSLTKRAKCKNNPLGGSCTPHFALLVGTGLLQQNLHRFVFFQFPAFLPAQAEVSCFGPAFLESLVQPSDLDPRLIFQFQSAPQKRGKSLWSGVKLTAHGMGGMDGTPPVVSDHQSSNALSYQFTGRMGRLVRFRRPFSDDQSASSSWASSSGQRPVFSEHFLPL